MKKALLTMIVAFSVLTVAACDVTEEGEYRPGLHLGYSEGDQPALAYIHVDADGFIRDAIIDSVYEDDETIVTKRHFNGGEDYGMSGSGDYLWVEQVDMLARYVVETQGMFDYELDEGRLVDPADAVSGVTVRVSNYVTALENALGRARLAEGESPADFDVPAFAGDGAYTSGILFGTSLADDGSYDYAVVAVNESGHIEHIKIDSGYRGNDDVVTKRTLNHGLDYIMSEDDDYLWVEQVDMLAADIVANQGEIDYDLDNGRLTDAADAVSGVTVRVQNYLDAVADALD